MSEELAERLGQIVDERYSGNWSKLADFCGIPKTSMQSLKEGRSPRWDTIVRVCTPTGISADYLLTGRGPRFRTENSGGFTPDERYIVEVFRSLPDTARQSALVAVSRPILASKVAEVATRVLSMLNVERVIADGMGDTLTDESIALIAAHIGAQSESAATVPGAPEQPSRTDTVKGLISRLVPSRKR
jgi:hypothetical protein